MNLSSRRARRRVLRHVTALLGTLLVVPAVGLAPAQAAVDLPLPPPTVPLPSVPSVTAISPVVQGAGAITSTVTGLGCSNTGATLPTQTLPCPATGSLDLTELTTLLTGGTTLVPLTAVPAPGWDFQGWTGSGCSGASATCTIDLVGGLLTGSLAPTAVFVPQSAEPNPLCDAPVPPPGVDCTAPVTKITKPVTVTPQQSGGSTKEKTATFEFKAFEPDPADESGNTASSTETTGATFECKLTGPGQTGTFSACGAAPTPGKQTYTNLADGGYTFSVQATDSEGNTDATPETFTWKVDTTAPDTTIVRGPKAWLLAKSATFSYSSTEPEGDTFSCTYDGFGRECASGGVTTIGVGEGTHTFGVAATDAVGNEDTTPATRSFTLPRNNTALRHSKGWKKTTVKGAFLKTASVSTKKGAKLTTSADGVRRIALVVSKGKGFGTVKVMLGKKTLKKISLASTRPAKKKVITVAKLGAPTSGRVSVVVVSSGKKVVIEGLGLATR